MTVKKLKKSLIMQKKITLIGCGNIGKRHLQAISKLPFPILLDIVEPNLNAQKIASTELGKNIQKITINWHQNISEIKDKSDLVIVATQAPERSLIIEKLLKLGNKRLLIEKIVCQSEEEYKEIQKNVEKFQAKVWVNCVRRYSLAYQKIKDIFENDPQVNMVITGGKMRLGSNAIHMIDLFSWFNNNSQIKLNGDLLEKQISESKRGKKFVEFSGIITGKINQAKITILDLPIENTPLVIDIIGENNRVIVDETNEKIIVLKGELNPKIKFLFTHVSNTTTDIILDIFKKDYCLLPFVDYLFYPHVELFNIFNKHLIKILKKEIKICPIT
jgi:predicted dehydrogenase